MEMVTEEALDVEEAPQGEEDVEIVGEKGRQGQKKKNGKIHAALMGGNAKKRVVQCFASPRKRVMAKHLSKVGEKGPALQKNVPTKAKPDQV
ncbi:hypothetical protein YC2023_033321 [Brassica napus]